jgi:hypothetical protein
MDVLRDAKATPGYRDAEQEARDRRVAQLVRLAISLKCNALMETFR